MKAYELRIGNWIKEESNYVRQWRPSDFAIYLNRYKEEISDKIEPIPLTQEILEQCGFKLVNKDKWEDEYYAHSKNKWFHLYKISGNNSSYQLKLSGFQRASPEHLHQLQNIYFALTGEELEYNGDKL